MLVFSSFVQGLEKSRATHKKYPRVVNIKPQNNRFETVASKIRKCYICQYTRKNFPQPYFSDLNYILRNNLNQSNCLFLLSVSSLFLGAWSLKTRVRCWGYTFTNILKEFVQALITREKKTRHVLCRNLLSQHIHLLCK